MIGADGEQMGIMSAADALQRAEETGLDLVEIAPTAAPPVCRIMDYGKFKYGQSKKEHSVKVHQKATHLKEVKMRPFTDRHDLEFKIQHAREFLNAGQKVKVTLMFRGREMSHQAHGHQVLTNVINELGSLAYVEQPPKMEGRNLSMLLLPKGKIEKKPVQKGAAT